MLIVRRQHHGGFALGNLACFGEQIQDAGDWPKKLNSHWELAGKDGLNVVVQEVTVQGGNRI